ncbi:MAG: DNA (cytosine-5-)-methyltransferase [Candidatus Nitrosotenuis sp.]
MKKKPFTFIDLFAGIGGMRLAFERAGGRCVFSSEWNEHSRQTYFKNFGEMPAGDITKINASEIPDHDVLIAGFPCQPFSLAGISKKDSLKMPHGFDDETQGTLFFDIVRILREKKPRAFLLENVKNLKSHDKGRTFKIIERKLRNLGYDVHHKVIDAKNIVPQHRERIFIAGFLKPTTFEFPEMPKRSPKLKSILEKNVPKKYTLTDGVWRALKRHAARSSKNGNGFGYGLANPDGISRTLSARYYKDGAEILISQGRKKNPRRLTPRECARLMGFPASFKIHASDNQAYKQLGNAVVPPLVEKIAELLVLQLYNGKKTRPSRACVKIQNPPIQYTRLC